MIVYLISTAPKIPDNVYREYSESSLAAHL